MKGYIKDFSNTLDSNRERVAFRMFGVPLFFENIAGHGNEANIKTIIFKSFFIYYID